MLRVISKVVSTPDFTPISVDKKSGYHTTLGPNLVDIASCQDYMETTGSLDAGIPAVLVEIVIPTAWLGKKEKVAAFEAKLSELLGEMEA